MNKALVDLFGTVELKDLSQNRKPISIQDDEKIYQTLKAGIEIIKEMRSFIEMLETLNSKEFNEHVRLLEKSKEYAESYNRQKRDTHPLKEGKTRGDVKPFTYSKKPNKPPKGQK